MLGLLAAATIAAQPAPPLRIVRGKEAETLAGIVCKPTGMMHTGGVPALLYREQDQVEHRVLGELPKANHEKAVARTVGGCAVPMVVQYQAGR